MSNPNLLPGVPLIESPLFDESTQPDGWDDFTWTAALCLRRDGFAIIDFPEPHLDEIIEQLKTDLNPKFDWKAWRSGKIESLRIQDAWNFGEQVISIASNQKILNLLTTIYGREVFPFQTLNFPVGTQQAGHSDHVHFSSVPERFMCGVWVAFEDTDRDNGPLFYYPGSHQWSSFSNEHIGVSTTQIKSGFAHYHKYVKLWEALAQAKGIKRQTFHARKGQALIWASNLVHGGSPLLDKKRTRWSQVTHYYFKGCGYYTPVASDAYNGDIYYRDITNIATGEEMPNIVSGVPLKKYVREFFRPNFMEPLPPNFNPRKYLELNPDVARSGIPPETHYRTFGKGEGRSWE